MCQIVPGISESDETICSDCKILDKILNTNQVDLQTSSQIMPSLRMLAVAPQETKWFFSVNAEKDDKTGNYSTLRIATLHWNRRS